MFPDVAATLERQHGLIRRSQALDGGADSGTIATYLRDGVWVRVRHGVYADGERWHAADEYREQPLLRARAALLSMQRAWVLSHDSAAHAHGLDILTPSDPHVHITRPGVTGAWTKSRVKHHLARFRAAQQVEASGEPCLDIARTVADLAREHGFRMGLVAADSALRLGVTHGALAEAVEPMTNWPGVRAAREAIRLADAGAANPAESLLREFVLELGIGKPETQFPVRLSNGHLAWCDVRVGHHAFEMHGKVKYRHLSEGGFASGSSADVVVAERQRERLLRERGLGVSNLYWEDMFGQRRAASRRRVVAEFAQSVSAFGANLNAQLAREAAEIRARHARPDAS